MRLLRIDLRGQLRPTDQSFNLDTEGVRPQLYHELETMLPDLTELTRRRIATYFPPEYTVFVRHSFDQKTDSGRLDIWVDDPTISWPAGLLARRAWKLSVPILAHVASETFAERIQGVALLIDRSKTRIASLAPARLWSDPIVVAVATFALTTLLWWLLWPRIDALWVPVPVPQ